MIVDKIKATVANTGSVDSYLVGTTGNCGRCHGWRALRTIKNGTAGAFLTHSVDCVESAEANTGGSVEESVVTA